MPKKRRILIVDDEHLIRWSLSQPLLKAGYIVETAATGKEALVKKDEFNPHMILLDIKLPDMSGMDLLKQFKEEDEDLIVIMITAYAHVNSAVQAFQYGAEDYIGKPFNLEAVRHVVRQAFEKKLLQDEVNYFRRSIDKMTDQEALIGNSPVMIETFKIINRCAQTNDMTVLIMGESGTGKELVAKAIHAHSGRSEMPFVEVNCAAIPDSLLENELFGHEKGAYTDAGKRQKGVFEMAEGGTVFLDEIGDMPLPMQAKILKVIENKRYRRLGGGRDIEVDARIIAATNQDLEAMAADGRFRADLFYRLNVMSINLHPLRQRKSDIPHLIKHFMGIFNQAYGRSIESVDPRATEMLMNYEWPGNVRELRNTIERAIIIEDEKILRPEHLYIPQPRTPQPAPVPDYPQRPTLAPNVPPQSEGDDALQISLPANGVSLEEIEKRIIDLALKKHAGNQTKAARFLKVTRDTLRYRMKKFDLL
ncbi:MAG: sigma-54-dependent Fis family transcriptional regulator [Deltaproteobacteria bacterium]|nr:sigma-54-dependent Fis family transcriptional regulator [Candidatus Anaeroferrophillus wilburensis]MBN2887842.1 sigma-54-dependent Fis family transcriptional regulator [Deltaproteobacteria bacterium]